MPSTGRLPPLAARAGVAKNTVYLFEAGQRRPTENVLAALLQAIETAGLRLVFDRRDGRAVGILGQDAKPDFPDDTSA
jgi:transcriptional regulator with XRE-family HTH domain